MPEKRRAILICLLLGLVTLAIYWPAVHFDFINYDDTDYIILNADIQHGITRAAVVWAFTTNHASNWHPLTWISHAADCALYGLQPGGHHLTNILFHTANVVLLFLLLWQWTGAPWRSALVAALFAWHPLHVESVAWISERKDVLSAFFFLLTLWAYGRYVHSSSKPPPADVPARHSPPATFFYLLSLFCFALALLSKPMVVTLPAVLLLLDFWPLNRSAEFGVLNSELKLAGTTGGLNPAKKNVPRDATIPPHAPSPRRVVFDQARPDGYPSPGGEGRGEGGRSTEISRLRVREGLPLSWPKLVREKIPFFVLAGLDCLVTFLAQKSANSVVSSAVLPFSARLANALVSYVLYLGKTIWPVNLALPYPYSHEWSFLSASAAALFLLLISAAVSARAHRQPFLAVGWFWFLGTLIPAVGLVQVGIQSMADRYTYLPLIGIFIALAWAIPAAWTQWPRPGLVFGAVMAGALLFLLTGAAVQLQYWRNTITLFSHTIAVTRDNILAEYNLAEALARAGRTDEAVAHYQATLAIHPNRVEAQYNSQTQARYNLGLIYRVQKKWPGAEAQFRAFIQDAPTEPGGYIQLGIALVAQGRTNEAAAEFKDALHLHPLEPGQIENIEILGKMETAYSVTGQTGEAIAAAQKIHDAALLEGRMDIAAAAEERLAAYRAEKP